MNIDPKSRTPPNPESIANSSLPPPPTDPLPSADTLMGTPAPGDKLSTAGTDRFVRLRVHASGGIGRVWLARDQRLERDVALKDLRPEFADHADVGRRFLAEARITGRLEHPGIAPIYELVQEGNANSYAMRFLQGRTLSEAIKAYHEKKEPKAALELAALLQAFIAVCNTVAFAHARGVLHRDLKGQNVLLGDFGEVIVLDWGLAKEIAKERSQESGDRSREKESLKADGFSPDSCLLTPDSSPSTLPGQVMGTPNYMSPEQASGGAIDQRADVYSLGAILYEILTGQAPFTDQTRLHQEKTLQALLRRIQGEPPTRPRQLVAAVPAPLQAVCLRALAKDPAHRYQSATQLAQEVQRWLADLPVQAHRDPWTVRAGRWARRHRTLVTSLGLLLAAALAGLAVTTVLINKEKTRTEQARARAEKNFHKAQEAVDRYFTQVSEDRLLNEPGMSPLRKELLGAARAFYEDFARDQGQDPASRLALAQAQLKLARITRGMGQRQQALQILEEARTLFGQLAKDRPDVDAYEFGLGQSYLDHGYQSYLLEGRSPSVLGDLEKARDILLRLVKKNPSPLHRGELAHAYNSLASYHGNFFKIVDKAEAVKVADSTEKSYLAAAALWKQLADDEPEGPVHLQDLAGGYANLAILYANLQDKDKCKDYLDKSMILRKQLTERFPHSPDYRENLAASYNNLGIYYRDQNQAELAATAYKEAAAIREKLVRENCQVVQFQQGLANSYFNFGNLSYVQATDAAGPRRESLLKLGKDAYQKAVAIHERLHEDHPEEHRPLLDYGVTLAAMGDMMTLEKQALAIPWYDKAIGHLEQARKQGEKSAAVVRALRNSYWGRAEARTEGGQFAQAVADWDRALALDDGSHKQDWEAQRRRAQLEADRAMKK